jgi:hypothetical protein
MEAADFSKMLVIIYQTTQHHICKRRIFIALVGTLNVAGVSSLLDKHTDNEFRTTI